MKMKKLNSLIVIYILILPCFLKAQKFELDMRTKESEKIYNINYSIRASNCDIALKQVNDVINSKDLTEGEKTYVSRSKAHLDTICPQINGEVYSLVNVDSALKILILRKNKKFGFYQDDNYNVIQPLNKFWSFKNYKPKGKFISECVFDVFYGILKNKHYGTVFHVGINGKQGLLKMDGSYLIPLKYEAISYYTGTDNNYFYNSDAFFGGRLFNKFCVINLDGKQITEAKYDYPEIDFYKSQYKNFDALDFKNGTGTFVADGKTEVIENYGKNLKTIYYDAILDYNNEYSRGIKNNNYTLLKNGTAITNSEYSYIDVFENGYAKVYRNGKVGLINKQGEEMLPVEYDIVEAFFNGQARVKKNGTWGLIDNNFKGINNINDDAAPITWIDFWHNNLIRLTTFNSTSTIVAKNENNQKFQFYENEGLLENNRRRVGKLVDIVKNDGLVYPRFGYVDVVGNELIPIIYLKIGDFYEDLVWAENNKNFYGFLNINNETKIPFIYEDAFSFVNGLAVVKKNGKYGMINKKNETIIPFMYSMLRPFYCERAAAQIDDYWVFIDMNNKAIAGKTKGEVIDFTNNKAILIPNVDYGKFSKAERNNEAFIIIDKNGNPINK